MITTTSDSAEQAKKPALTFGQKLVGINFNPAGDDKVTKAKQLCAELTDLLAAEAKSKDSTELDSLFYQHALGEILNAQMCAVKYLTNKF